MTDREFVQQRWGIIGRSQAVVTAVETIIQVAPTDLSVVITGESGTGKEVFARAIHGLSNRAKRRLVSVNCAAIPETLLESELFGHEKGAFTGAVEQRIGFFESADQGTIFLDEIGEMPLATQVKLLRILENGEYSRLGSSEIRTVNARIIAATNRDLEECVKNGTFRKDLFFRLHSVHLSLPPLRNHIEDIPLLVDFIARKTCANLSAEYQGVTDDALHILRNLPWPGNIRELKNLVETIVTINRGAKITPEILAPFLPRALKAPDLVEIPTSTALTFVQSSQREKHQQLDPLAQNVYGMLLEIRREVAEIKAMVFELKEQSVMTIENSPPDNGRNEPISVADVGESNVSLDDLERSAVLEALKQTQYNKKKAAGLLGISVRTLYRRLKEYSLESD